MPFIEVGAHLINPGLVAQVTRHQDKSVTIHFVLPVPKMVQDGAHHGAASDHMTLTLKGQEADDFLAKVQKL